MKIEHIAMYVKNLEAAREFFTASLNGHSNDGYHNQNTDFRSCFISFDDGARLELITRPGLEDLTKPLNRTGYVHIAFSVGSRERVDQLTDRLQAAPVPPATAITKAVLWSWREIRLKLPSDAGETGIKIPHSSYFMPDF